jgi:hypothetical protein
LKVESAREGLARLDSVSCVKLPAIEEVGSDIARKGYSQTPVRMLPGISALLKDVCCRRAQARAWERVSHACENRSPTASSVANGIVPLHAYVEEQTLSVQSWNKEQELGDTCKD